MQHDLQIHHVPTITEELADYLLQGVSNEAAALKGMPKLQTFAIELRTPEGTLCGGLSASIIYGSIHYDMLFVEGPYRHLGWGTKLVEAAEGFAKEQGCTFAVVNTMDWEAQTFYELMGYKVEFTRKGYQKDSQMHMLRKELAASS